MHIKVALVGNPNVGKTSIFNTLTGLSQKVGNYPGITVDKKTGICKINENLKANIIDLPGSYSAKPSSRDEEVVLETLLNSNNSYYPDVVVVVAEVDNLKRNLLLYTQIKDLGFPTILTINMSDLMPAKGILINIEKLSEKIKSPVVLVSSSKGLGFERLKEEIANYANINTDSLLDFNEVDKNFFTQLKQESNETNIYKAWLNVASYKNTNTSESDIKRLQQKEIIKRYQWITEALKETYTKDPLKATGARAKVDRVLTHPVFGYVIFFGIMLLVFQAIFSWSSGPMNLIDGFFAKLSNWVAALLPAGKLTDLITEGVIPGIGGVVVFIPQIAILFMFIAVLEESGYMSRVVFLMDKIMRPFGLSGKSVVPLISGVACAIPAIMSARNIENAKERLITMLVTPFTTCSARIPVYVIIISLVIPEKTIFGFIGLQGLVMAIMYSLGFITALLGAWLLDKIIKTKAKSYLIIEIPSYRWPQPKNVLNTMVEKTRAFVEGAGKIILALSIILWFLGSHGPDATFGKAEEVVTANFQSVIHTQSEFDDELQGYKLKNSYIGIIGNTIQPVFKPLGYDWKISIAVLTSFAAREVFVGNLATLYNIGSQGEEEIRVIERMRHEVREDGSKTFNLATGVSLLLFYAFAMQCISTIAIMLKESNSWKWTVIQTLFMTGLAYLSAFVAYTILK